MSYTMTIESPEKAAWFEQQRATMTSAELGELFLAFLAERFAERQRETPMGGNCPLTQSLTGAAKHFKVEDDHGILARAALEKYKRISL